MRRRSFVGKNSGNGLAIFFLIIICFPALGWIFNVLDFILSNIGFIIYMIVIVIVVGLITYLTMDSGEDEEEEI